MAAQTIGAGHIGRLGKITRAGLILNITITGALTLALLAFDRPVLTLFLGPTSPAVDAARHIQFLASWSYILFGMTIVLFGTMRAGGVVLAPIFVLAIAMYPVRLGFYFLAYPALGPDALWLSFPIGSAAAVLMATIAYRRPGWRQKARVVDQDECAEESQADGDCSGRMAPAL
jgi:Na+-driven multidrug efflux pump